MVELVDVNKNDPDSIKYINKFSRRNKMLVTKELIKSRNMPDIGSIQISSEDCIKKSKITSLHPMQKVKEIPVSGGASLSEVIELTVTEGV